MNVQVGVFAGRGLVAVKKTAPVTSEERSLSSAACGHPRTLFSLCRFRLECLDQVHGSYYECAYSEMNLSSQNRIDVLPSEPKVPDQSTQNRIGMRPASSEDLSNTHQDFAEPVVSSTVCPTPPIRIP